MRRILLLSLMAWTAIEAQPYTLGIGVYPGDPRENFAPVAHADQTYRNLALHRPVYQSSSYDYNLTAQLITDGIKDTKLPRWVAVSSSEQGELPKNEREWLLDHNWLTGVSLKGTGGWVQVELAGGELVLHRDLDLVGAQQVGGEREKEEMDEQDAHDSDHHRAVVGIPPKAQRGAPHGGEGRRSGEGMRHQADSEVDKSEPSRTSLVKICFVASIGRPMMFENEPR